MRLQQIVPTSLNFPISPVGGENDSPTGSSSLTVDQFFMGERIQLRERFEEDPLLSPFRYLPDGLLTFLCSEKMHLALTPETRRVLDKEGNHISGDTHSYGCEDNEYHPKYFKPFDLQGFWIPVSEGQFFSPLEPDKSSPLIRSGSQGLEILFLIHPKSEKLYAPLMEKYASCDRVKVSALSLSSFRTLLIALPGANSLPQYAMVKVSLNEKIGGDILRILTLRECAGSVASSLLLQTKRSECAFIKEDFSFVPSSDLLSKDESYPSVKGAGMIHREIPECLLSSCPHEYVIPLFALFGSKNRVLLDLLIDQSGKTPTQFVTDALLKPLANIFIGLLYDHHVSIEAHGQNLLLKINTSDPSRVKFQWMYRDMGGVNPLMSDEEFALLPEELRNPEFFYSESHVKDAADVLESLALKVLFNLTKQFFKSEKYSQMDPQFAEWKFQMTRKGFDGNWDASPQSPKLAAPDADPLDAHAKDFTLENFCRYGYFEKIFGQIFLETMEREAIFIRLADCGSTMDAPFFLDQLIDPVDPYNTCISIHWFKDLIEKTYPYFLEH